MSLKPYAHIWAYAFDQIRFWPTSIFLNETYFMWKNITQYLLNIVDMY